MLRSQSSEMHLFDELPPVMRAALREACYDWDIKEQHTAYRQMCFRQGAENGLAANITQRDLNRFIKAMELLGVKRPAP